MTDHTRSTETASQLVLAHQKLGSWAAVASLLGDNPKTGKPYGPAMAWHFGSGKRPIPDTAIEAWQKNVTPAMLRSWGPRIRQPRVSIEVSPETRDALRNSIKKSGDTWDDAFSRILSDTEPGSAPHLFGFVGVNVLHAIKDDIDLALYYHRVGYDCGFTYTDEDICVAHWWLDRLELELSMRKAPDWQEVDSDYAYEVRPADYYERF
jgi:hypothetical protein